MSERERFAGIIGQPSPTVAFCYGGEDPCGLAGFDVAVTDPGHEVPRRVATRSGTLWLAYLSIGEALECTPYFKDMPQSWLGTYNTAWGGRFIDQAARGWPRFFVERIAGVCARQGHAGFFVDTVDAYLRPGEFSQGWRLAQRESLLHTVRLLRRRHPESVILLNRGFELLDELHGDIDGMVLESLYCGWDQARREYIHVSDPDRDWLLRQIGRAKLHGLPVISIEYCAPQASTLARATARRVRSHGIIPSICDPGLQCVHAHMLDEICASSP